MWISFGFRIFGFNYETAVRQGTVLCLVDKKDKDIEPSPIFPQARYQATKPFPFRCAIRLQIRQSLQNTAYRTVPRPLHSHGFYPSRNTRILPSAINWRRGADSALPRKSISCVKVRCKICIYSIPFCPLQRNAYKSAGHFRQCVAVRPKWYRPIYRRFWAMCRRAFLCLCVRRRA